MFPRMNLKVLLPFEVCVDKKEVSRVVVETLGGSLGLLPRRLDCTAALVPGILVYETDAEGEVYLAVDQGIMVKTGEDILISVRNAIVGKDLDQLRESVDQEFLSLDEREQNTRSVLALMESSFIRRFTEFKRGG